MKTFIFSLMFGIAGYSIPAAASGSMVGGGDEYVCTESMALTRATRVVDVIGTANGYAQKVDARLHGIELTEGVYFITIYYPMPLSAPAYTVKILKDNCEIFEVRYSNFEG